MTHSTGDSGPTGWPNQGAPANRRPALQSGSSGNLSATVAADRAFPAAVAELGRSASKFSILTNMSNTKIKNNRTGTELSMQTFPGRDRRSYLVFRTGSGSYHTFVETEAKQAARECGATVEGNTRTMWGSLWKQ